MKKKKQRSTATTIPSVELKALIHHHSIFFDKLVDLIPPKFYLSNDDVEPRPWFPGLSKAAKASLKHQSRENLKLARRNRLDPAQKPHLSSTLDLLKQSLDTQIPPLDGAQSDGEEKAINLDGNDSVTYEELRQKLRNKIELLRGNRGCSERSEKKKGFDKKRKRNDNEGESSGKGNNFIDSNKGKEKEIDIEKEIEFGKVRIGDDERNDKKNKKRKVSKAKELERARRLEEVKREKPEVATKESWKAAANRAMGVKVHDDPRLLKESMKKEKRRKEKHAQKWKERVETTEKMKGDRQKKRRENISGKIHEKKMRKIAKREKKLMRPGFEGRKEGFITKD